MNALKRFITEEEATTTVEYAFMVALVLLACIVGVTAFGVQTNVLFERIDTQINAH